VAKVHEPPAEQDRKQAGVDCRLADVRLDLPPEVHAGERGGRVHEAVQALPAPAEAPHRPPGRGGRQRHEQEQGSEPGRDIGPLHHVGSQLLPVERLVHEEVPEEVRRDIGECEEAEHAAEEVQLRPARQHAQRRDGERREQEPQAPDPQRVLHLLDGIRAERECRAGRRIAAREVDDAEREPRRGQQAQQEDDRLCEAPDRDVGVHQNQRLRSRPLYRPATSAA